MLRWERRVTRSVLVNWILQFNILLIWSNKRSRMPSRGLTTLKKTEESILDLEGAVEGGGRGANCPDHLLYQRCKKMSA
jgi:hypothetical protein